MKYCCLLHFHFHSYIFSLLHFHVYSKLDFSNLVCVFIISDFFIVKWNNIIIIKYYLNIIIIINTNYTASVRHLGFSKLCGIWLLYLQLRYFNSSATVAHLLFFHLFNFYSLSLFLFSLFYFLFMSYLFSEYIWYDILYIIIFFWKASTCSDSENLNDFLLSFFKIMLLIGLNYKFREFLLSLLISPYLFSYPFPQNILFF